MRLERRKVVVDDACSSSTSLPDLVSVRKLSDASSFFAVVVFAGSVQFRVLVVFICFFVLPLIFCLYS